MDILDLIPDLSATQDSAPDASDVSRIRVLDDHGDPVHDAIVRVASVGSMSADELGYAEFYLPDDKWYSLVITHGQHEEILYMERLAQGETYTYRPDPSTTSARYLALSQE
jgi:hypothetical protein